MKYLENIQAVAALEPDYLGFIFYAPSKRNFEGIPPKLPKSIKKTGVFVNATIHEIIEKVEQFQLQAVQLHGDESVEYIRLLKEGIRVEIIKVFSVGNLFDFEKLKPFEDVVDYFLFDTKGKERGGNGIQFDWTLLEKYPLGKPYFLSGGIGLEDIDNVLSFLKNQKPKHCYALDINSKFEIEPGLKSVEKIEKFKSLFVKNLSF